MKKRIVDAYSNLVSRIRYWANPANRLHITTLPIYPSEWDEVYLHACFQILVNYVEELSAMAVDTTSDSSAAAKGLSVLRLAGDKHQRDLADLYEWWILRNSYNNRPLTNNGPRNDMVVTDLGVMHLNFTPEQEVTSIIRSTVSHKRFAEDERQLRRLTKLRSRMWM